MSKNLYIISGCNAAGKTTASYTVLPEILDCREFVNADEIARGLSPFNPGSVAIEAGRLMLKTPELAILRVAERVKKGGHDIPEDVIRRRYVAGIKNLFQLFMTEVDYWDIYDNSENPRIQIACGGANAQTEICDVILYKELRKYVE